MLGCTHRNGSLERFDKKLYLAVYYLGQKDLQADLACARRCARATEAESFARGSCTTRGFSTGNRQIRQRQRRPDRRRSGTRTNFGITCLREGSAARDGCCCRRRTARVGNARTAACAECVIASAEMRHAFWSPTAACRFQHDGISIAHVVPEALDGGGLAAIRTGDWMYLDLARGEFQVVDADDQSQRLQDSCRQGTVEPAGSQETHQRTGAPPHGTACRPSVFFSIRFLPPNPVCPRQCKSERRAAESGSDTDFSASAMRFRHNSTLQLSVYVLRTRALQEHPRSAREGDRSVHRIGRLQGCRKSRQGTNSPRTSSKPRRRPVFGAVAARDFRPG